MSQQSLPVTISTDRLDRIATDAAWARNMEDASSMLVEMCDLYPLIIAARVLAKAAPVSPDADLLKEAVGLLRRFDDEWNSGSGWAVRMDDLGDDARAFLSKLEERGHD